MQNKKRIIIVGGTSAIAEHCARLWVKAEPLDLVLIVRDLIKVEQVSADLKVRAPKTTIQTIQADFLNPKSIQLLAQQISKEGSIDIVLIAHGVLSDQQACQKNLEMCRDDLEINALSPVLFAEAFIGVMESANHGTLALIGSPAGDRGRKSNYIYGAGKALIERYVEGLQHRLAKTKVKIVLIKPGPTKTPMTANLNVPAVALADVGQIAKGIVRGIFRGKAKVYVPIKWAYVMAIIRYLPSFVFNKLDL